MEAPEKIYIDSQAEAFSIHRFEFMLFGSPPSEIEYVRSDLLPRWVPVEEALPTKQGYYWAAISSRQGKQSIAGEVWYDPEKGLFMSSSPVTHWLSNVPPTPEVKR